MIKINYKLKSQSSRSEEIFLNLYEMYEKDIYRMAYVYTNNKEDSLDIVQETAYKSYTNFSTLNDLKFFKTWLLKITINCSLDFLRVKKQDIPLKLENIKSLPSNYEDISLSITVDDLLNLLNEDEKTYVLLKYYQGYTFSEISEIVNIPISTVKSVLYRALEKLRKYSRKEDMYVQ